MNRGARIALIVIACVAFAIRIGPLLGDGGPLAWPSEYDDGVYFSASALLLRGVLPYRDFVFVHPPGIAWFHALTAWWHDPATAFAAARVLTCVIGAINTFLAGLIVLRAGSPFGALVAATLYATYPEAVSSERSTLIEPVLNLFGLLSAYVWLSTEKSFRAGILGGIACAMKLLGGIWVVAAMLSAPRLKSAMHFIAGGVIAGVVLLAPLALLAPSSFIEQVLVFQLTRPPDGTLTAAERLPLILDNGHLAATVFSVIAILAMLRSAVTRAHRFFAIATLLTCAAFLASSSYWTSYNAYLAASQCVLAGLGVASVRRRWMQAAIVLALVVMLPRGWTVARSAEQIALREAAVNGSLFAFDPTCSLIAGHLPAHGDGAPVIVDSYGAMLLTAMNSGAKFKDAADAFRSAPAQPAVRLRMERSRFVILDWRAHWQLPANDWAWITARSLCVTPDARALCIRQTFAGPIENMPVTFGEGWYNEEGTPPSTWRWMSGRGTMTIPAKNGRLYLEMRVPLEALRTRPRITIELDGRAVDQFTPEVSEVVRVIEVRRETTLVVNTSETFTPERDPRQLGLMLRRVSWLE